MTEDQSDLVFRALGDPTRRRLLELISEEERSVKELTGWFGISQPAVSQHLRLLKDAGLALERRSGRNRFYRLQTDPLHHVQDWLQQHTDFWATRMEGLGAYLRRKHGEDQI